MHGAPAKSERGVKRARPTSYDRLNVVKGNGDRLRGSRITIARGIRGSDGLHRYDRFVLFLLPILRLFLLRPVQFFRLNSSMFFSLSLHGLVDD